MKIGAQLYTVREFCKDLDSFAETLKKVASLGYTSVQVSGTCKYDPYWLRDELKKNGLTCDLTHYDTKRIKNDTIGTCASHYIFGCKHVGVGMMPGRVSEESYHNFVRDYKEPIKTICNNGFYFMYHNHYQEFARMSDGRRIIEALAEDFPADQLGFTLDTYWMQFAGADSVQYIKDLAGRIPCIHLKDMSCKDKVHYMEAVGSGNMNFPSILSAAEDSGCDHVFVEQDHCNGEDPFVCLKRSYDYLHSLGLN